MPDYNTWHVDHASTFTLFFIYFVPLSAAYTNIRSLCPLFLFIQSHITFVDIPGTKFSVRSPFTHNDVFG